MNYTLHFLRPEWFWGFVPLLLIGALWLRQKSVSHAWRKQCDKHLLPHLVQSSGTKITNFSKILLLLSASFLLLCLTGPAGKKLAAPTYHTNHPRLILLDLSDDMLKTDLKPNRLTRAKFKLHDLFKKAQEDKGQFGLMVYTNEPFVVSPITQDAETIDALIHELSPAIMPVDGNSLSAAIQEGGALMEQSGIAQGSILVLTGMPPSKEAVQAALATHDKKNITLSILPITQSKTLEPAFQAFAKAGGGDLLKFTHNDKDIDTWLRQNRDYAHDTQANDTYTIPLWRDDGRFFLIPALFCLIPVFRRNWLMRMFT